MSGPEDDTLPVGPGGLPNNDRGDTTRLSAPLIGQRIDGFFVKRLLGGGGMGDVYLAEQNLGAGTKLVALKTIRTEHLSDSVAIQRFQEEALAAGTMKTNYVAEVMSYGKIAASPKHPAMHYLVMEFASDGTLHDHMASFPEKRLPIDEGIRLLRQAAEGMLAAERRVDGDGNPDPIVHRDIKPANLLLQRSGATDEVEIRISDFGAVKRQRRLESGSDPLLSQAGAPMTPIYASPEQWNWEDTDHRSDMYSLGATFYHALTGKAAPDSNVLGAIRRFTVESRCLSLRDVLADVPEELNTVIEKMTARNVDDRYASFADVIEALKVFEQQPASFKKVLWSIALAGAAVVTAIVLAGGVEGVSAKELADDYAKLRAEIEARLGNESLQALPEFLDQLRGFQAQTEDRLESLRQSSDGDSQLVPVEMVKQQTKLDTELKACLADFASAQEALAALARIRSAYRQQLHSTSMAQIGTVQAGNSTTVAQEKAALATAIKQRLADAEQTVTAFENELRKPDSVGFAEASTGAATPLVNLKQRISDQAPALTLVAQDLARRLVRLSAAVDEAIQIESRLPEWQADPDAPQEALRQLVVAAKAIREVNLEDRDALDNWWTQRRKQLTTKWLEPAKAMLGAAKAEYEAAFNEARDLPTPEANRAIETTINPQYESLRQLFGQVRDAAAVVFRNDVSQINKLAAITRPTLDYSVENLTESYRKVRGVAQSLLDQQRNVTGEEPTDIVAKLVTECDAGIAQLATETRERISSMGDTSLPRQLEQRLVDQVASALDRCNVNFQANRLPLVPAQGALSTLVAEFAAWNDQYRKNSKEVYDDVSAAAEIAANFEKAIAANNGGSNAGLSFEEAVSRLSAAVAVLKQIRDKAAPNDRVGTWRTNWIQSQLTTLTKPVEEALRKMARDGNAIEQLRQLDKHLEDLWPDKARRLRDELKRTLEVLQNSSGPKKPDGWRDEVWAKWPAKEVPAGLQAKLEDGMLVCWFEARRRNTGGGTSEPVEMILIESDADTAFLVDRHEVCVGEMLHLDLSEAKDPSGYFARRQNHWFAIKSVNSALISWTSRQMASRFAQRAYPEVSFSLPTPEQWRLLLRGNTEGPKGPAATDPKKVTINTTDNIRGVYGLTTGLSEWLADGTFAGNTDYKRGDKSRATWKKGVGFRCILNL